MSSAKRFDHLTEEQVSSRSIFDGRLLKVRQDTVRLTDGSLTTREYYLLNGAVSVLPLTDDNEVIVVNQFRYPLHKVITEIPAGKLDTPEEDRLSAAKRELREETGLSAEEWIDLGTLYGSVACSNEVIGIYLARGLHQGDQALDEGEFLNVDKVPLSELLDDVMAGKIADPKTQIAVLKTARFLGL